MGISSVMTPKIKILQKAELIDLCNERLMLYNTFQNYLISHKIYLYHFISY